MLRNYIIEETNLEKIKKIFQNLYAVEADAYLHIRSIEINFTKFENKKIPSIF